MLLFSIKKKSFFFKLKKLKVVNILEIFLDCDLLTSSMMEGKAKQKTLLWYDFNIYQSFVNETDVPFNNTKYFYECF